MTGNEIRRRFLEHFASREHLVLPSAPLVPRGDPSTLFISAGMQPLQPYYQGFSQPPAPRLASCQKCLRTGDIDEVGRTDRHNTFFEMLGNFTPTGRYFKETAIPLAWELVTEGFEMPVDRLRVTIHPSDDEAFEIWTTRTGDARRARDAARRQLVGPRPRAVRTGLARSGGIADAEAGCGQPDCVPDHCDGSPSSGTWSFRSSTSRKTAASVPSGAPRDRHGHGPRADRLHPPGQEQRFRDRPARPDSSTRIREHRASRATTVRNGSSPTTFAPRASSWSEDIAPSNEGRGYVLRRLHPPRDAARSRRPNVRSTLGELVAEVVGVMEGPVPGAARARSVDPRRHRCGGDAFPADPRAGDGAVRADRREAPASRSPAPRHSSSTTRSAFRSI